VRDCSIFELGLKLAIAAQAEDLGTVGLLSRRDIDERSTFIFRAQVPCLEYVSLIIESSLLLRTNLNGRLYVGFEKFSRMEPVVDRFLRIADISERVYVFGEDDWNPPKHPHIKLLRLEMGTKLSREWFVIADTSTLRIALVTRDEEGFAVPNLEQRYFSALKTSDNSIVSELSSTAEMLADHLTTH
jgi:hypothetical protein